MMINITIKKRFFELIFVFFVGASSGFGKITRKL